MDFTGRRGWSNGIASKLERDTLLSWTHYRVSRLRSGMGAFVLDVVSLMRGDTLAFCMEIENGKEKTKDRFSISKPAAA